MEKIRFPNLVLVRMGTTIEILDHGDFEKLELRMQKLQQRYPQCSYAIYCFIKTNSENYPLEAVEVFCARGGNLKVKLKDANLVNYMLSKQRDLEFMSDIPVNLQDLPIECYIFNVRDGNLKARLNPDYQQILKAIGK